ncbi:MAG TPA: hypothetical protein V6D12_09225 [Candidatus Obscuribacterales bacterium]
MSCDRFLLQHIPDQTTSIWSAEYISGQKWEIMQLTDAALRFCYFIASCDRDRT